MALFGVIGCLMFITCFATTKERVQPIKEENLNIARDVKILFRNDQWRILSVYNFMMLVAVVIRGGAVVYYVNSVLHKGADVITIFMLGGMFASMLGSVLAKPFGTRFVRSDSLSGLIFSPPRWAWSALSSRYNIGLRCSACIF
jgi:GPH family glycoside/pentoside/hexuronide:cation symporter